MEFNLTGIIIFTICYAGIALGRIPGMAIDRTGIALLGGMLMLVTGVIDLESAIMSVDYPTLIILFGLMLLSAQFRMGGFYSMVTTKIGESTLSPGRFMVMLILLSAGLSALLSNDVICLALTPVIIQITLKRGWNPFPFLFALAASSNIGSGMTIIGNPQNMFIGQKAGLDFGMFLLWCAPPALISLIYLTYWGLRHEPLISNSPMNEAIDIESDTEWDKQQTTKAIVLTVILVALFFTPIPHFITVLGIASVLLMSRKLVTGRFMALVDWPLLILFSGLFLLVEGFRSSGGMSFIMYAFESGGIGFYDPGFMAASGVILSILVSNVPAVMLLMADWPEGETQLAYLLSLTSTFAGNLVLIGSIANLIVAEQARRYGIIITFSSHLKWTFIPAVVSILIAVLFWFVMMLAF
jgi:Na+/H+ antiporter NhaD/arsenite permease-like protein